MRDAKVPTDYYPACRRSVLFFLCRGLLICFFLFPAILCSPAYAVDVYYSVGTSQANLENGSGNISISSGVATFTVAQSDEVGVGDRIVAGGNVYYISARTSATVYNVITATGATPGGLSSIAVTSVSRAFNTLDDAVNVGGSVIDSGADSSHLATVDLTAGPYILNIVCYGDTNADTAPVNINGWITDATSYINIYASAEPYNKGVWDARAYRLVVSSDASGIIVNNDNVYISGLQIELQDITTSNKGGIVATSGNDNVRISRNIIRSTGESSIVRCGIQVDDGGNANMIGRIWNNIIYDFQGTLNMGISVSFSGSGSKAYLYNNTVYNNTVGIYNEFGSTLVAKNNLSYLNNSNYSNNGTYDAASTNNLSGPGTDADIPDADKQDGVTVTFVDAAGDDFRLGVADAGAKDKALDLSQDSGFDFSDDVEKEVRGRLWDIGADERAARMLNVVSPTDPIVVQLGSGVSNDHFQITFTDANNGIDMVKKGKGAWGSDLIASGTLFSIGGENGTTTHEVLQDNASEVIVKKEHIGVTSYYHIYPSGRIVLDALGASSITVNQTGTFTEYADGVAHTGGYHAYADLLETSSPASDDYGSADTPSIIAGTQVTDRQFDYDADGFEEGRGSYSVIAAAGSAVVDFNGKDQTRYSPALLLEEFYPKTQSSSALTLYWDAADTTKSGSEMWAGTVTSALTTASTGFRGTAQENDTAGDYASIQTASNISAGKGTLSLWIRSSSTGVPSGNEYVFFADTDFNLYFDTSGYLNFNINSGVNLTYSTDIYDGKWHEITCTWDYTADSYILYVDGKPQATSTTAYAAPTLDGTMYLTAQDASGTNRFLGLIDEIHVYNDVVKPTGHVLVHSRMDSAADVTAPQVGSAGTVTGATFTSGMRGNAATFNATGEYITIPSAGNITAAVGALEALVKSSSASNPSGSEQIFFGDGEFNIFFDANGRLNFEISADVNLTDTIDTYDGLWHHVCVMWDYTADKYFLYVDGRQAASALSAYSAPTMDATMYLGAADALNTRRYNGLIDDLIIYDDMILPYGAYNVPAAWGDTTGKFDPTLMMYWDADSSVLNIGRGSATLGGGMTAGTSITGDGLVNDDSDEYASFPSVSNIVNNEGSLAFWIKSAGVGNPASSEYLFFGNTNFNVFFDTSGYINFNISSGVNLQYTTDVYDGQWHHVRCTWDYTNDGYEMFIDGMSRASSAVDYDVPTLDATVYVTAKDASGTNRFVGSLDELYITNSQYSQPVATANGVPIMQPQMGIPYSYRIDVGDNLAGLASSDILTPLSDFTVSATNSFSEYSVQYFDSITTTGGPSIVMGATPFQNANAGTVVISYIGTDSNDDTVTYVAADCEYYYGAAWHDMATSEATEAFTDGGGAVLSYIWNASTDVSSYDGTISARLRVNDGLHLSPEVPTVSFDIDTLAPTGLGSFGVDAVSITLATLSWTAVTEDNWVNNAHYEIWYGTVQADVQNRNGTASEWDNNDDTVLATRTTTMTTITGLSSGTMYFFKIWAVDGFANEMTVLNVFGTTNETASRENYYVQIDPVYDELNDAILVTTSLLLKSGTVVTDLATLTLTYVGILDNIGTLLSGNLSGVSYTIASSTNAVFYTTWDPAAGLSADTIYTIISKINYNGRAYSGVKAFNVDELGNLTQNVQNVSTKIDTFQDSADGVDTKVDTLTEKIDDHEEYQAEFRTESQGDLSTLSSNIGAILEDTSQTLPDLMEDELSTQLAKGVQAEIITRPTTVETGSTVPIRFRSSTGLAPTLTVYDPSNFARISAAAMGEVGTTGVYEYKVAFDTAWGLGSFTIFVEETTKQSVDGIMMDVVSESTTGTSADSTSAATLDLLYTRVTSMNSDITGLVSSMSNINITTAEVGADVDRLLKELGVIQSGVGVDAQAISDIVGSVEEAMGEDDSDYETILGKLGSIEEALAEIGSDAAVAASFTRNAKNQMVLVTNILNHIRNYMEKGLMDEAKEQLVVLAERLIILKQYMEEVPEAVTTDAMADEVQLTVQELHRMASEKGIGGLIPSVELKEGGAAASPEDMIEIRNGVSELKSLMVEIRSLLDQEINKPIVHGWLEGE